MPANEFWFWIAPSDTPPFKPRKTRWRMTEEDARARWGDAAVKVEGSLEVRTSMDGATTADHLIGRGWHDK